MQLTTRGKVTRVFEKRAGVSKSGKSWSSQDYGFVADGSDNMVIFNIFGEDIISNVSLKEGDDINATFEVRSREYNGRYYTEVRFIECEKMADEPKETETPTPTNVNETSNENTNVENPDELPF